MASRLIARVGDLTSHGAPIISSNQDGSVFCEGKEVAVDGAVVQTHYSDPTHPSPPITSNLSSSIFINGKAIVLNGSIATCGAVVQAGSAKSFGE